MKRWGQLLPWLAALLRTVLGVAFAIMVVVAGYIWFNDPIVLDGMRAEMTGPASLKIYVSGYKRHDRCPGQWQLILNDRNGPWLLTEERRTGVIPVGKMSSVPVEAYLLNPVPPGTYTATVIVQYYCLIPFRHRASFELRVPHSDPPTW